MQGFCFSFSRQAPGRPIKARGMGYDARWATKGVIRLRGRRGLEE